MASGSGKRKRKRLSPRFDGVRFGARPVERFEGLGNSRCQLARRDTHAAAQRGSSAEETLGASELRSVFLEQIESFKQTLEERDRQILEERILAEEPKTLAEMGEEFGVTRERVRQLEARLVKRLREHMKSELVDFEYYAPDLSE